MSSIFFLWRRIEQEHGSGLFSRSLQPKGNPFFGFSNSSASVFCRPSCFQVHFAVEDWVEKQATHQSFQVHVLSLCEKGKLWASERYDRHKKVCRKNKIGLYYILNVM